MNPVPIKGFDALILMISGLWGLAGVMLLAAGAHADPRLTTAGMFLLFHAAVVIGLLPTQILGPKLKLAVLLLLLAGAGVFAGDIVMRVTRGAGLLPMLAPVGGTLSMVGWLGILIGSGLKLFEKPQNP
ncbi:DUF423 domain-containing protein [Asticcacaulis endophyticus]|uniref:DUF423 domain-containing protein n=1 Tax=Asticcacaulis endophyticus TaxID=1395890 RepID=A0A918Q124_9CAUL|nr:DUF423 domain-containing protein [Asticcacaulis endophyticus]GGZ28676.1 hypothetical protein GCM10011273_13140 [Asticcacaulis endophyticus]